MTTWQDHPALRAYLKAAPRALLSDIDGTLSPISRRPEGALVDEGCRRALQRLASKVDLLGFITGRPVEVARALVGVEADYVGNHGLERWHAGRVEPLPELLPWRATLEEARRRLRRRLPEGALLEDKDWVLGLHFRTRPDLEETLTRLADEVSQALGLQVKRGRMVLELAPPIEADKGAALARLVKEHRLRAALYLGDDGTDVDAFRYLHRWNGCGVCVGVLSDESPPEVSQEADLTVEGVDGVRRFLDWLDGALGEAAIGG